MPPSRWPRFSGREIALLKFLARRTGLAGAGIVLSRAQRRVAVPLWRARLIEAWYRQTPELGLQGPCFTLSIDGCRIASAFLSPPSRRSNRQQTKERANDDPRL